MGEAFKQYIITLQDLMRPAGLLEDAQLEKRLYRNSSNVFYLYVHRHFFKILDEILS